MSEEEVPMSQMPVAQMPVAQRADPLTDQTTAADSRPADTAAALDPPIEHQISDRPEPMPLWVAWVGLTVLTLCAAWALYAYIVTQYVPE